MKIMSLNVNQFRVLKLQEGSWAKEILTMVKIFLYDNPNGVVFLYEIPERFRESGDFESAFAPYEVSYSPGSGIFFTVAIKRKDSDWLLPLRDGFSCGGDYKNRYIELYHQKSGTRVLGIHNKYFQEEIKKYAIAHKDEKVMILGDFNVTTNDQRVEEAKRGALPNSDEIMNRYDWYETMVAESGEVGYTDAVDKNAITYFPGGTAIDHALFSPSLKGKCKKAKVFPQSELELSDHAVIIVEVEE